MAMYGKYLRISFERLKQLQSQPEALKEHLRFVTAEGYLQAYKEQYFDLNRFWEDLDDYLGRLPQLDSLWREWGVSSSSGEIGKKIENVSFGVGTVRFVTPNQVQAIANVLTSVSKAEVGFMKVYRKNYRTRQEDHYEWVLSTYQEWKQFWQKAAQEGQAVLFWIT
jgi:hypothetical protein